MYARLKMLYQSGMLTAEMLEKAVTRKWITEDEKNKIIAEGKLSDSEIVNQLS